LRASCAASAELALIAVEHGRLGLCRLGAELRVPVDQGSGEADCRAALRRIVGSGEGSLRLLGVVPPAGDRAALEVWTARRVRGNSPLQWFAPAELLERVGSPVLRDPATLAALTMAARSPLIPEWSGAAFGVEAGDAAPEDVARASRVTLSELRVPVLQEELLDPARAAPSSSSTPSCRGSSSTRGCSHWPKTRDFRRPRAFGSSASSRPTSTSSSRPRSPR